MTYPLSHTKLTGKSPLLHLPPELRIQIYEYIVDYRVVYIRMKWVGISSPAGFLYNCFNNLQPLLDTPARDLLAKAVPFHNDITILSRVCRQMHEETSSIPFKLYTFVFEDVFTLDHFVMASLGTIPLHHKQAIHRVAVAPPGPHRTHEKFLQSLQEVLLIDLSCRVGGDEQSDGIATSSCREILRLTRDTLTNTWIRSNVTLQGGNIQY